MEQQVVKEAPEQEYEYDMEERLSRVRPWFCQVNAWAFVLTSDDLVLRRPTYMPGPLTHLEDISWQYPTEPLERAMLRFFEAISKWRGRPELETVSPSFHPRTFSSPLPSPPSHYSLYLSIFVTTTR
jgi:hypothetical protein